MFKVIVLLSFLGLILYNLLATTVENMSPGTLVQLATSSPYYYYHYPYGAWGHYYHYPYYPYDYGSVYYPSVKRARRRWRRALRGRRRWRWPFW